jgi:hypothetical protein
MNIEIMAGLGAFATIIVVVLLYGRSKKKQGASTQQIKLDKEFIKTRKETNEHRRKTKRDSRDDFISM